MLELSAIRRIKLEVKSQEINETKGYKDLQHDLLFLTHNICSQVKRCKYRVRKKGFLQTSNAITKEVQQLWTTYSISL